MDAQKVDLFLMTNAKNFPDMQIPMIRERLMQLDENKWTGIQYMQFKDPIISLVLSLLAGSLGIDRFFIGDTGLGIGKLCATIFTCGIAGGIWAIVDWFLIMGATREKNLTRLMMMLQL